ncbi:MAG: Lrp/AsnC family transcriptional regulator [Candidatus Methanomethylophilaceae archaeon]|nr:Lrp/AsnC family transcriptional regulator [Candidatus Methanomethylophilaceae archaeon]
MSFKELDELDKRILEILSTSCNESYRQVAKQLNVHPTTIIQRVNNLETKGYIRGYRAHMDYQRLGFDYMGLVNIYADNVLSVQERLCEIPQVVAVFDITGESDCLAWIACVDREEFSSVVKSINAIPNVRKTNTSIILDIKKDPYEFVPHIF